MEKPLKSVWHRIVFASLAWISLLIGAVSENAVTILLGTILLSATASSFLTSCVRSDHIVKRTLEVVFLFMVFGAVIYGYAITTHPIFGIIIVFVTSLFVIAFVLSYLLPKIRGRSEGLSRIETKERKLQEQAYDVAWSCEGSGERVRRE